ncbi:unnamed protein product [marine sediment metagenome]|uniref:Uncharacterized protein n=1 Tax=marine sediment metagenome TaxID=412755 RepID=X1FW84_9ZZZZ
MKLKARVFELSNGKYRNVVELAQTMGISKDLIYSVRRGERNISGRGLKKRSLAFSTD